MRLIDKDWLLADLGAWRRSIAAVDGELDPYVLCLDGAIARVNEAPDADAEPVRHGRWEMFPAAVVSYRCSECKRPLPFSLDTSTKFCPNCGAKMNGGL